MIPTLAFSLLFLAAILFGSGATCLILFAILGHHETNEPSEPQWQIDQRDAQLEQVQYAREAHDDYYDEDVYDDDIVVYQ